MGDEPNGRRVARARRRRGPSRRMVCGAAALVLSGALASCSTTTPRHGATVAAGGVVPTTATGTGLLPGDEGSSPSSTVAVDVGGGGTGGGVRTGGRTGGRQAGGTTGGSRGASGGSGGEQTNTSTAGEDRTGVTDDTVTVSLLGGFTGVFGPFIDNAMGGLNAWRDSVNAAGGIHGRRLVFKKVDHKETVDGAVAACKEIRGNGSLLTLAIYGVKPTAVALDCLDKAGIPSVYTTGSNAGNAPWTHQFGIWAQAEDAGVTAASLVRNVLKQGDKRLGAVYVNASFFKEAGEAYVNRARSQGMNVVSVEVVEANQTSFVSEMVRMQQANVENVMMMAGLEAIGILRDARAIGFRPTFSGAFFTGDALTQASRDLMAGIVALRPVATKDTPGYAVFEKAANAHGVSPDGDKFQTWAMGLGLQLVLERAGRDLSRQSLERGAATVTAYDDKVNPPISWGPGVYVGTRASFPVICCTADWSWKAYGAAAAEF